LRRTQEIIEPELWRMGRGSYHESHVSQRRISESFLRKAESWSSVQETRLVAQSASRNRTARLGLWASWRASSRNRSGHGGCRKWPHHGLVHISRSTATKIGWAELRDGHRFTGSSLGDTLVQELTARSLPNARNRKLDMSGTSYINRT
jgi:hypothetical protein